MSPVFLSRCGAATGAVFAVVLFVAAGNGSGAFSAARAIAGMAALVLFIPFAAYLTARLRDAEGRQGWLAGTALAAGITGITLKIVSVLPALALHRAHIADGTAAHKLFDALDNGATVIALYPLAVFCGAIAILGFRTTVLARWVAIAAAVTSVALAVNACFLDASFVPALLLFIAWTLVTSVSLVRSTRAPSGAAAAAAR